MKFAVLFSVFLLLLTGCAEKHYYPTPSSIPELGYRVNLDDTVKVRSILKQQYQEWQGTEYDFGGLGKDGVDCSGFVYITFRSKMGITLPRSSKRQIKTGYSISKDNLRSGDLLFFKTSYNTLHVGIYFKNGKFIHASRKKGVMISSLKNEYWNKRLVDTRRIS